MSDDSDKAPGWSVCEINFPASPSIWAVKAGYRLVIGTYIRDDARRIVEAVNGADELTRERDELRAEVERLRAAAVEHHGDPAPTIAPDTLAALNEAAARLTATIERHEVLLGIAPKPATDDEIAKLRSVALAVAGWLDDEWSQPLGTDRHEALELANNAVRAALGCRLGQGTVATLCALAGGGR